MEIIDLFAKNKKSVRVCCFYHKFYDLKLPVTFEKTIIVIKLITDRNKMESFWIL